MKIAIVHEFLTQFGGAERVLISLSKIFPKAQIFSLIYNQNRSTVGFEHFKIKTSFVQNWPGLIRKKHKLLLPIYPLAVEQFDLSAYDLVISNANSFAKGVLTSPNSTHLCYCHSPTRYLWDYSTQYLKEQGMSNITRFFVEKMLVKLRLWDFQAAQRVDYFIANSENVKKRIKKYYKRDAEIIYPPVRVKEFKATKKTNPKYFLMVGRLSPYKKVDLVIEVFKKIKDALVIIGAGSELVQLKQKAPKNVIFKGFVPDNQLKSYYQNCHALIFPQEEDFGIVPIEAMASGRPVIAFEKGGALETIKDGETGIFFKKQTIQSLYEAIIKFKKTRHKFSTAKLRQQAENFDQSIFEKKIKQYVRKVTSKND